jgi:hypothetical protein
VLTLLARCGHEIYVWRPRTLEQIRSLHTKRRLVALKHRARRSQAERAAFAEAVEWASMGPSAHSPGTAVVAVPEAFAAEAA